MQVLSHLLGRDQAQGLPLRQLVAELSEPSAGQLERERVGPGALAERGRGEAQQSMAFHDPGDVQTAGLRHGTLE